MTDVQTEALVEVICSLSSLAPERFKYENLWYVFRWGKWRRVTLIGRLDDDRIVGACQEEIEARGWMGCVTFAGDDFSDPNDPDFLLASASVCFPGRHYPLIYDERHAQADSPALALATALRDALREVST